MFNKARIIKNLPKLILGGGGVTMGSLGCVAYSHLQDTAEQLQNAVEKFKKDSKGLQTCNKNFMYNMKSAIVTKENVSGWVIAYESCLNGLLSEDESI